MACCFTLDQARSVALPIKGGAKDSLDALRSRRCSVLLKSKQNFKQGADDFQLVDTGILGFARRRFNPSPAGCSPRSSKMNLPERDQF